MGLESAVTVAEQDRYRVVGRIGHRQVEFAITIEIRRNNGYRCCTREVVHARLEGAITVADENRHGIGSGAD